MKYLKRTFFGNSIMCLWVCGTKFVAVF